MTFSKTETSYVACSQKRAAYDHKGSGWHLSGRQVWQVQDRWWFLPAYSATYCSFLLDLSDWHMVMPPNRFIFPCLFSTRSILLCFVMCTRFLCPANNSLWITAVIGKSTSTFWSLQWWYQLWNLFLDLWLICWLVQRDDKFTAPDF